MVGVGSCWPHDFRFLGGGFAASAAGSGAGGVKAGLAARVDDGQMVAGSGLEE